MNNVTAYMYGGNSRSNASIAVTASNSSLVTSKSYSIDASSDVMLVMIPNNQSTTT